MNLPFHTNDTSATRDESGIFYHTEPNRPYPTPPEEQRTPHQKISFLQMAELTVDGTELACDRDSQIVLPPF
ncbi:hypothetical protein FHS27_005125 [Rhodopirellula rubra]|uniref:Uncharacterized protein n=1 Tax=Aporhodopirellula rubra TaxID=980271 RepID=A0A7W5E316_9BACT|nr:hypothetical protein [Aporhodopirellula rubra]MBB3209285.1 hypothetical protein [Aporhodopirellula rubra]